MLMFDLQTAERCPDTKIIMAGYSQGAQVLHEAANSDLFMVNPLLVNHVVACKSQVPEEILGGLTQGNGNADSCLIRSDVWRP